MTGLYKTPKVIHVIEADSDGNKRTVRYIREDTIESFAYTVSDMVKKIQAECDRIEKQEEI